MIDADAAGEIGGAFGQDHCRFDDHLDGIEEVGGNAITEMRHGSLGGDRLERFQGVDANTGSVELDRQRVRDAVERRVIAALPGLSPERLREVLVRRDREPQNVRELLAALGPAQAFVTSKATKAVRVSVRIDFDNGRRMRSEAVILLSDSGNDRDDFTRT